MCGIFGFSGNRQVNIDQFKLLGIYNLSRGKHSCGHVCFSKGQFHYDKSLLEFNEYIESKSNPFIQKAKNYIGHTRHATKGAKTLANAHPFIHDTVAGVHNGTLEDYDYLVEHFMELHKDDEKIVARLKAIPATASDSGVIYHLFDIFDKHEVLSKYNGAAAFVFVEGDGTLNVYHDDQRPMFVGGVDGEYYFSSLENSLKGIGIPKDNIVELPINTLYEYKNGILVKEAKIERLPLSKPVPVRLLTTGKNTKRNLNPQEEVDVVGIKVNAFGSELVVPISKTVRQNSVFKRSITNKKFSKTSFRNGTFSLTSLENEGSRIPVDRRTLIFKKKDGDKFPVLMRIFDNGNMEQYRIDTRWYKSIYLPSMKKIIEEKELKNIHDVNFLEVIYRAPTTIRTPRRHVSQADLFSQKRSNLYNKWDEKDELGIGDSMYDHYDDYDNWGYPVNGEIMTVVDRNHDGDLGDFDSENLDSYFDEDLRPDSSTITDIHLLKLNGKYISVYIEGDDDLEAGTVKCRPMDENYMISDDPTMFIICKNEALIGIDEYYEDIQDDIIDICLSVSDENSSLTEDDIIDNYEVYFTLESVLAGTPKFHFFDALKQLVSNLKSTDTIKTHNVKVRNIISYIEHQQLFSGTAYINSLKDQLIEQNE